MPSGMSPSLVLGQRGVELDEAAVAEARARVGRGHDRRGLDGRLGWCRRRPGGGARGHCAGRRRCGGGCGGRCRGLRGLHFADLALLLLLLRDQLLDHGFELGDARFELLLLRGLREGHPRQRQRDQQCGGERAATRGRGLLRRRRNDCGHDSLPWNAAPNARLSASLLAHRAAQPFPIGRRNQAR